MTNAPVRLRIAFRGDRHSKPKLIHGAVESSRGRHLGAHALPPAGLARQGLDRRSRSGSMAKFAASRRASLRDNSFAAERHYRGKRDGGA